MLRTLDYTVPMLPAGKPRYLMGVGTPEDILESVGIIVNRNVIPYDPESSTVTSGIRLGFSVV